MICIIMLGVLIVKELYIFVPGFLGAITMYILTRNIYFRLVEKKKWKPTWTAIMFIEYGIPISTSCSRTLAWLGGVTRISEVTAPAIKRF